jgi:hypothetical protein
VFSWSLASLTVTKTTDDDGGGDDDEGTRDDGADDDDGTNDDDTDNDVTNFFMSTIASAQS